MEGVKVGVAKVWGYAIERGRRERDCGQPPDNFSLSHFSRGYFGGTIRAHFGGGGWRGAGILGKAVYGRIWEARGLRNEICALLRKPRLHSPPAPELSGTQMKEMAADGERGWSGGRPHA